jgi:hypothetical protein
MALLCRLPIALHSLEKGLYELRLIQLSNGITSKRGSLATRLMPLVGLGDGPGPCNVRMFTELKDL